MALEPITRQEKIIAGQDLTPITRMEKFLKNFGGGGGGGGGFVVTVTIDKNGTGSADKTFEEVMEQIKAGNLVVLKTDGLPTNYVLTSYSYSEIEKNIMFSTTFGPNPQSVFVMTIMLLEDNSIMATMYTLTATEMGG